MKTISTIQIIILIILTVLILSDLAKIKKRVINLFFPTNLKTKNRKKGG